MFRSKKKFTLDAIEKGHQNITYRGVPCLKCPFDYVIYQMILNEVKPDLIIEIGTNTGGSALYMAELLDAIGNGIIHTIDIDDRSYLEVKNHNRIKLFHEGWESYDLKNVDGFNKVLVIEDSSHEYLNTKNVINKFYRLVTKGSYLIIEDGIIDALGWKSNYNGGPVKAIKEFLPKHPEFILEYKWLNMFGKDATFNTLGYLKKEF